MDGKSLDHQATPPAEPGDDSEPAAVTSPEPEPAAPDAVAPGAVKPEATLPESTPSRKASSALSDMEPSPAMAVPEAATPELAIPEVAAPIVAVSAESTSEVTDLVEPRSVDSDHAPTAPSHEYPRFRLMARTEHMTLLVSFTILCLTGLPQKFPFSPISQGLIDILGGIEVVRMIHRWAAIVLILGTVYHLLTSAYRLFVKHEDMRMLPDLKDGIDLRDTVAYNLGFIDEPPKMRKFNFGEKFEYWAVVWGTAVMIVTGFILWNPIAATRLIPGSFIPVALEAHGWEAVLAAVSIVIWHLYNVLVKHRNLSMFTGTITHKIMEEEHALELERLDEGGDPWKVVPPKILARRRRAYFAVASVVVVLALVLVVWMFTFEDTAIIIPQATRELFVPLATPNP